MKQHLHLSHNLLIREIRRNFFSYIRSSASYKRIPVHIKQKKWTFPGEMEKSIHFKKERLQIAHYYIPTAFHIMHGFVFFKYSICIRNKNIYQFKKRGPWMTDAESREISHALFSQCLIEFLLNIVCTYKHDIHTSLLQYNRVNVIEYTIKWYYEINYYKSVQKFLHIIIAKTIFIIIFS